ncbi:hypothetical protein JCM8547_005447 [Rhodosporidiobolus lusitaniae]
MRLLSVFVALCTLLATLVVASPADAVKKDRVPVQFGVAGAVAPARQKETKTDSNNYLITLERSITNSAKDKILDVLLRSGAVVKEEYNYRVFKGVLFSAPNDKGLKAWESSLEKVDGVKYVEKDQTVSTQ